MSEPYDAALRVNGEIVFRERGEAIDQRLAAEVEYDEAREREYPEVPSDFWGADIDRLREGLRSTTEEIVKQRAELDTLRPLRAAALRYAAASVAYRNWPKRYDDNTCSHDEYWEGYICAQNEVEAARKALDTAIFALAGEEGER